MGMTTLPTVLYAFSQTAQCQVSVAGEILGFQIFSSAVKRAQSRHARSVHCTLWSLGFSQNLHAYYQQISPTIAGVKNHWETYKNCCLGSYFDSDSSHRQHNLSAFFKNVTQPTTQYSHRARCQTKSRNVFNNHEYNIHVRTRMCTCPIRSSVCVERRVKEARPTVVDLNVRNAHPTTQRS